MKLFRIFGLGARKILAQNCSVTGTVTTVQKSCLCAVKKPVRLYPSDSNTIFSHYIHFIYTVGSVSYTGKLFVSPNHRCPQRGDQIDVYYDPEKPENYACYAFGPASRPIGW